MRINTKPSTPLLASEGWHRFITGLCLLACVGAVMLGVARLFDPMEGHSGGTDPMDYVAGVCFILLGIQGCRFLIRQFTTRPHKKN